MKYDPIKKSLGKVFNQTPLLRRIFYRLLDILLLRAWYINKELRDIRRNNTISSILDAGSGFGQYVYRMSQYFPKATIYGFDVKESQINDCNHFFSSIGENLRIIFQKVDLTKLEIEDSYNLILSVDVMEHIEDDELVFSNFFHAMKDKGTLIISTPSDQGGSDTHHHHDDDEAHGFVDEHVRDGYSIKDITQKLTRAGFSNIEAKYSYGVPGKISWKLSMKYPILLLGISQIFFIILPFYYLVVFPWCIILNFVDIIMTHKSGTGIIVKATKNT